MKVEISNQCVIEKVDVRRNPDNPIITIEKFPRLLEYPTSINGPFINGPSVMKVPEWIENKFGKYYMYFADHAGKCIFLVYADHPNGPWSLHGETLKLEQTPLFKQHIASPDVHVDNENHRIIMYYHGLGAKREGQWTSVATSNDGINFTPSQDILGKFYFRVFKWRDRYYAINKNWNEGSGELLRSKNPLIPFEKRGDFIKRIRHSAIIIENGYCLVFYSRVGDAPEGILLSSFKLDEDWSKWQESEPIEVLCPEKDYEGISFPVKPSTFGARKDVRELRDPCVFKDNDKYYLFYTVGGENGIATAEIKLHWRKPS